MFTKQARINRLKVKLAGERAAYEVMRKMCEITNPVPGAAVARLQEGAARVAELEEKIKQLNGEQHVHNNDH